MSLFNHKSHKALKPGGIVYIVLADVEVGKQTMLEGYELRECADGWYQVFTVTGVKHFYRISPDAINDIKEKLKAI